jgi:hypothetical protein
MPGLSSTIENSPLCSSESDSTYSMQSETSQPSGQQTGRARSTSANKVPGWASTAHQLLPNGSITSSHELQSPQFDSMLGQFESYASPRMATSGVAYTISDVPNPFEAYGVEPVGIPALSMYSKPLPPVFSESTSRVPDFGMGGVDNNMKPLMEPQLEALCISMAHLTPLDDYIATYWQTFHTVCPIIHRGTFDPMENILLSSAVAAMGTQYHNTAAARQKGAELNDYCRRTIDRVSLTVSILNLFVLTEA